MKGTIRTGVVLMLAIALFAVAASATVTTNTIIVTPSNPQGWTWLATSFSHPPSQFPAACGFSVSPPGSENAPGAGHGAFWGNVGNFLGDSAGVDHMNQVFLGTNNYNNIKLSDISRLYYRSFTANYWTGVGAVDSHLPKVGWHIELAVSKNSSGTSPTRYLQYRPYDGVEANPVADPWQQKAVPFSGEPGAGDCGGKYNVYNGQECMCTLSPSFGNGVWVDYVGINYDSTKPFVGDWANVLHKYSGAKIMSGPGYYPWPYNSPYTGENPTQTGFSFVLGTPKNESGSINMTWADCLNEACWLDYLVIAYTKDGQSYEDHVYFRPDPTPGRVLSPVGKTFEKTILDKDKGWRGNIWALTGKVMASPAPSHDSMGFVYFYIQDGSPGGADIKVRVKMIGDETNQFLPTPGDTVRVQGVLHRQGFANSVPDLFCDWNDFKMVEVAH